jgi:ABC-2 type transport system permease protein
VVAFGSCLVLVPLIAVVQVILGYPVAGSLALGAAVGLSGCVFAAIAAVCAQLTVSARTARGMAIGALGVAFLLRAVGDAASGTSWLRWASPLGWAEQMQVYASPRWMAGALFVVAAAVGAGGAAWLATHRDLGEGLLPVRPGRPEAAGWLRSPLALAWRLQRGALLGWAIGFVLAGAVLGSAASGIGAVLNTSPQARRSGWPRACWTSPRSATCRSCPGRRSRWRRWAGWWGWRWCWRWRGWRDSGGAISCEPGWGAGTLLPSAVRCAHGTDAA